MLNSFVRITVGFVCIGVLVALMIPLLVLLLPWRVGRIRVTNAFGTAIGKVVMTLSGCRITIEGAEHVGPDRPAIYACNHTSILDAFTTIWLTPAGTVGVAKKEVLFYPFYGQAWWLAGHVFLDRGKTEKAKAALRKTAEFIRDKGLHLCILPEGTRAESGRLLPFKKGVVHMALATKLPVVPMVTIGLQQVWRKGSLSIQSRDVRIVFLPPIATDGWSDARTDEHLEEIRSKFLAALPADQQPETPAIAA